MNKTIYVLAGLLLALTACAAPPAAARPAQNGWQTYTSEDAAYAFDYPAGAQITTSDDAALRYKLVFVQFPISTTNEYEGASVMVLDNPQGLSAQDMIASRYTAQGMAAPSATQSTATVNGRPALKLERDGVIGDGDKFTVLVEGAGVIYRINLFGGGVGGQTEPPPEVVALFDRMVQSFRVLDQPLKPSPHLASPAASGGGIAEPPIATQFSMPMLAGNGVTYGVPEGMIASGTHIEWLDYAIRNLDQWRVKCYGVDWSRMLHTGEDWYRTDYLTANTAGSPVVAVADGIVERHNPGISYPGNVVLIRHRLPDGRNIFSMYGHVANVRVVQGQRVSRGQQIATVLNQGYTGRTPNRHPSWDSHLHFEMRWFLDGTNIYVPGTNAYGYNFPSCTYAYPGRGYTYIINPNDYPFPAQGYVDASDFITQRAEEPPPGCTPVELIINGGFESGPPGTPWVARNSLNRIDPLIYKTRRKTGTWGGWLGNLVNYQDTLAQTMQPAGGWEPVAGFAQYVLSFWRFVQSAEPAGNGDDRMVVTLVAPDGSPIGTPFTLSTATQRGVWIRESIPFNLSGMTQPALTLSLAGINDADNRSSFFIDDVSFRRQCAALAAEAAPIQAMTVMTTPEPSITPAITPAITPTLAFTSASFLPAIVNEAMPEDKDLALQAVSCSNVLQNAGFEDTANPVWTGIANTGATIYNVLPGGSNSGVNDALIYTMRPRTGARSGRVGSPNVNAYWNELVQTAQLPANVTSATLTYWRYLDTQEASTTAALDTFRIGIETDKGIEVMPPQQLDNRSAGRGQWVQETLTVPNATALSNQKVWLSFKARLDGGRPTALYIDDAALTVCAAR
jgi:murein DD-endopeptidase MepM/ murein hydrolase activator NlpD